MITEPEMTSDEPEPSAHGDLLPGGDPSPVSGRGGWRGPLLWVLVGIAVSSAVWGAVLKGADSDSDRSAGPDVHGYRIDDLLCSSANFEPLTSHVPGVSGFAADYPARPVHGPTLDHLACVLGGTYTASGWENDYTMTATVDLHKKADPGGEFGDITRVLVPAFGVQYNGDRIVLPDSHETTTAYPGLGDRAYLITGTSRQALTVLYGGAVLSVTIDSAKFWVGPGKVPKGTDPFLLADTRALRAQLPATMRHLMRTLSS